MEQMAFDLKAGEVAKADGIAAAVRPRRDLLALVREAVMKIALARESRKATADDFQFWLAENGYSAEELGNAAGAVFTKAEWDFTGEWVKSKRVTNHAHLNRVWKLR